MLIIVFASSDALAIKQAQVDKLYASLKDLAQEKKGRLEETLRLYMLGREIEDIEQWIAEREVVAGSHELGQDFEHVTVSTFLSSPKYFKTGSYEIYYKYLRAPLSELIG